MVPIAEMSSNLIQIKAPMYLWEPRTPMDDVHRLADDHTKSLIQSRSPYQKYIVHRIIGEIRPPGMLIHNHRKGDLMIIRHADKENRPDYLSSERGITERGERESELLGSCLPNIDVYNCSETRCTSETAYCMNRGNGGEFNIVIRPELNALRYDHSKWCYLKAEYRYLGVLRKWRNNEFTDGELPDFRTYSISLLNMLLELTENKTACIVTHDHMICVISTLFTECRNTHVPYMGGFVLKRSDIIDVLNSIGKET